MENLMIIGGVWLMCALCAVLFIRGASAQTALRRVPVTSRRMQRATLRREIARDYRADY
jgi:hypothetical protein